MATWVRVTSSERCPICGKGDFCGRSADGLSVTCMRVESSKPCPGRMGGWFHQLDNALPRIEFTSLAKKEKPVIDWDDVANQMFNSPKSADTRTALSSSLGVNVGALSELGVGSGWDDYRSLPFSSWPERDASGKVLGIVRRYADGSKKTMRYSTHGIYFAQPVMRMRNGPVFVVEGGSDTAALLSLGVNVIGKPSNLGGVGQIVALARTISRYMRFIVIGENDQKPDGAWPGKQGAVATAERLTEELKRKAEWVLPPAKDVRAWLNSVGPMTGPQFLQAVRSW